MQTMQTSFYRTEQAAATTRADPGPCTLCPRHPETRACSIVLCADDSPLDCQ